MGYPWSKPPPQPPPQPFLENCWRNAAWGERDQLVKKIKEFPLDDPDLGIRVLLHGPVGTGKSSFINSVKSALAGRVVVNTLTDNDAGKSFTTKYKTCYIKEGVGRLPFLFNDIMGFESKDHGGVLIEDIVSALKGHIPEGYKFNPCEGLTNSKPEYIKNPKLSDKVHCLVSVVSADKISMMSKNITAKMRDVRQKASDLDIPQLVVMTWVDTACPEVKRDLKNVYRSKEIRSKMEMCSHELGVPLNCILPVKNYHEETYTNKDIDVLILEAVTKIVEVANDYIWNQKQHEMTMS